MSMLAPIRSAMRTDRGQVRDHNEDYVTRREPSSLEDEAEHGWLYIVADGVGGAEAGEVASQFACERTVAHYLESDVNGHRGQRLVDAMQAANTDLRQLVAERDDKKRMATTMVATAIDDQRAFVANVGDSRGYHWRQDELQQITKDQSLVAKLVEEGAITEAEAVNHPHRNVILYSIGSERSPQIDLFEVPLEHGDKLLLCSDGLTRHVSDEEICQIVGSKSLQAAADHLVDLANQRGGQDNITAMIIGYGVEAAETVATGQAATVPDARPRVAIPDRGEIVVEAAPNHGFLLSYTLLLAFIEAVLIILVWLWLRV